MGRAIATGSVVAAAVLAFPFVASLAAMGGSLAPSAEAFDDVPADYLAIYQEAAARRCPTLPWSVLATVGKIESDHGRTGGAQLGADGRVEPPIIGVPLDGSGGTQRILDTDGGLHDGDRIYDRAVGPMQFVPATWSTSGMDASGDGLADPHNAIDAIHAAAAYLCASGASEPARVPDALWAYNHSWEYVEQILDQAARYADGSYAGVPPTPALIAVVLANPRLHIYEAGRADIAAGQIDARVLTVLQLASRTHTLHVSSLRTGHSRCVGGGNYRGCHVSNHWHGRGVDISIVDGRTVSSNNVDARHLALWLTTFPEALRPSEIGTPWADLAPLPGYFTDAAHQDHLHVGYD